MTTPEDSFLGTLARRHYLPEGRSTILPRWVLGLYVATELLSVIVIAWTCVELVYDVDWARPESIALDAVASLVFVLDWVVGLRYHAETTLPADTSSKDRHRAGLYAAGSYLVHPGRIVDLLSGVLPLPLMLYSGVAARSAGSLARAQSLGPLPRNALQTGTT